jgi:hypothetical protein
MFLSIAIARLLATLTPPPESRSLAAAAAAAASSSSSSEAADCVSVTERCVVDVDEGACLSVERGERRRRAPLADPATAAAAAAAGDGVVGSPPAERGG